MAWKNAKSSPDSWNSGSDPLGKLIALGIEELDKVRDTIDLVSHSGRIRNASPDDLYQAIRSTKDMLEAIMKTILDKRGVTYDENI